mgnify:CR=1 FL=1
MPRGRPRKVIEGEDIEEAVMEINEEKECCQPAEKTEKEKLLELYAELKALGINSIGDLEVKIARL